MREIKFRYILRSIRTGELTTIIFDMDEIEQTPIEEQISTGIHVIGRDEYTGLKDKNGKEIYEGDIGYAHMNGANYLVKFGMYETESHDGSNDIHHGFYLTTDGEYKEEMGGADIYLEVIGNVHENPELLEKTE